MLTLQVRLDKILFCPDLSYLHVTLWREFTPQFKFLFRPTSCLLGKCLKLLLETQYIFIIKMVDFPFSLIRGIYFLPFKSDKNNIDITKANE